MTVRVEWAAVVAAAVALALVAPSVGLPILMVLATVTAIAQSWD